MVYTGRVVALQASRCTWVTVSVRASVAVQVTVRLRMPPHAASQDCHAWITYVRVMHGCMLHRRESNSVAGTGPQSKDGDEDVLPAHGARGK